jgi:hypothetical protein
LCCIIDRPNFDICLALLNPFWHINVLFISASLSSGMIFDRIHKRDQSMSPVAWTIIKYIDISICMSYYIVHVVLQVLETLIRATAACVLYITYDICILMILLRIETSGDLFNGCPCLKTPLFYAPVLSFL